MEGEREGKQHAGSASVEGRGGGKGRGGQSKQVDDAPAFAVEKVFMIIFIFIFLLKRMMSAHMLSKRC